MTTTTEAAPANAYDRRLANDYAAALAEGREAYERADELLAKLHERLQPGVIIPLRDGTTMELVDNFAHDNVAWKPAGVRRLDAKIHKPRAKGRGKANAETKSKS
ncbi:hypothetical protein V7x_28780 [Crateriforma conspicua]|uniref:Uncharacterized protein n=1 Tax=Crateriforma conspicua TaxID=2527996 RepID=A0A5C6FY86_9PLAN|nr:hypothetical protein [Crateriforma conspicua]TWU67304.1 hypothetical protein V7x_28780 [Crateriforma conspicua]